MDATPAPPYRGRALGLPDRFARPESYPRRIYRRFVPSQVASRPLLPERSRSLQPPAGRIESTNRMYLRTLKALQDLRKAPPEQAGQPIAPPAESGSPPAGDNPGSPLAGDQPSSQRGCPSAGDQPSSQPGCPPAGGKWRPPRKPQPLIPPIGSVPLFTRPPAGRPRAPHENHESSLQTGALLQQNIPCRDTIDKDRSSGPAPARQPASLTFHPAGEYPLQSGSFGVRQRAGRQRVGR